MSEDLRKETFKTVYGVETIKEVSEQFRLEYRKLKNKKNAFDEVSSLFQKYVLAITFMYSIPSIKNNLGIFRKIINQEGGIWKESVKSTFYIFDVYKAVTTKTAQKIETKEEVKKDLEINVKLEIEKIKNILSTKSYHVARNQNVEQVRSYYLAYILGLSTGRRFTEIFKTVNIRKKGKKYIFNGILKKDKNQKNEVEANILYLSVDEVKEYMKELRKYINTKLKTTKKKTLKETSEEEINTIFSKVYNNAVKRITEGKIPNFHELRHYYTIEGTKVFKKENESDRDVRYRILGHHIKEDTTRTYKTIK
jgi:ribosomal protein S13